MPIRKIHHVAYRCKDAKQTVEWYQQHLNMGFVLAIAEDQVPSTKAPDPYMHIFLDAGGGNVLAFFELPNSPEMGRDTNTPAWVQHIALEVDSMDELLATKARLQAAGIEVTTCRFSFLGAAGGELKHGAVTRAAACPRHRRDTPGG